MLNECTFQGRFAADPELKTTQSGISVVHFRMAVARDTVGQDGQRATDWLDFVAWRKTAEFVAKYFRKGSMAIIQSQCQTRSYEDRNGQKRTAIEFIVNQIHFSGYDRKDESSSQQPSQNQQTIPQNYQPQQMGFATQRQRSQWQSADQHPGTVQSGFNYSQGSDDDFTVIDDSDDLPF